MKSGKVERVVRASGEVGGVLQGVLRSLEQKKPQLEELVQAAGGLRATENRQQLHGKGQCCLYTTLHHSAPLCTSRLTPPYPALPRLEDTFYIIVTIYSRICLKKSRIKLRSSEM